MADLPLIVYTARVTRMRKPNAITKDTPFIFFFDDHYALSTLYCQRISNYMAVPRLIGATCPPENSSGGEDQALYFSMLCSTCRCPGRLINIGSSESIFRLRCLQRERNTESSSRPEIASIGLIAESPPKFSVGFAFWCEVGWAFVRRIVYLCRLGYLPSLLSPASLASTCRQKALELVVV